MKKYNSSKAIAIGLVIGGLLFIISNLINNIAFFESNSFERQIVLKILLAIVSISVGIEIFRIPFKEFSFTENKKGTNSFKYMLLAMLLGGISSTIMVLFKLRPIPLLKEMSPLQMIIAVWIFSSICEEIFCRGFIQSIVESNLKSLKIMNLQITQPVLTSAVLFGLMHFTILYSGGSFSTTLLVVISTFLLGLVCGFLKEKNGLRFAIFAHLAFNIGGVFMAVLIKISNHF